MLAPVRANLPTARWSEGYQAGVKTCLASAHLALQNAFINFVAQRAFAIQQHHKQFMPTSSAT